jgi:hypothetical protein
MLMQFVTVAIVVRTATVAVPNDRFGYAALQHIAHAEWRVRAVTWYI